MDSQQLHAADAMRRATQARLAKALISEATARGCRLFPRYTKGLAGTWLLLRDGFRTRTFKSLEEATVAVHNLPNRNPSPHPH